MTERPAENRQNQWMRPNPETPGPGEYFNDTACALTDRVETHRNPPAFDPDASHREGNGRVLPGLGPPTPAPQLTHHAPCGDGRPAMVPGEGAFRGPPTLGKRGAFPHPEVRPDPSGPGPARCTP